MKLCCRPSVSIGQHGVIARKKPRRMLDDVEDAGPCAQTSVEGSPGKAGATRPQTYQRFPGQQRVRSCSRFCLLWSACSASPCLFLVKFALGSSHW